jgi:8-oxo-dGTP pyrophosphatase MutT (NUDIX family)
MKKYPDTVIVDQDDHPIGAMQMPEAIRQGKIVRISRVLLRCENDYLIQERGPDVMAPGLLNETASGHIDKGETYLSTAERELTEEVSSSVQVALEHVGTIYAEDDTKYGVRKSYEACFLGEVAVRMTDFQFDKAEVAQMFWLSRQDIEQKINQEPRIFTYGFIRFWKYYQEISKL